MTQTETYKQLSARQMREVNALPLGFAFNNNQFAEMMRNWGLDPETDKDKIIRFSTYSGFCRKTDADMIYKTFDRHAAELKEAITVDKTGECFIKEMFLSELENHEYSYTGDVSDAIAALGFTYEEITNNKALSHGLALAAAEAMKNAE